MTENPSSEVDDMNSLSSLTLLCLLHGLTFVNDKINIECLQRAHFYIIFIGTKRLLELTIDAIKESFSEASKNEKQAGKCSFLYIFLHNAR